MLATHSHSSNCTWPPSKCLLVSQECSDNDPPAGKELSAKRIALSGDFHETGHVEEKPARWLRQIEMTRKTKEMDSLAEVCVLRLQNILSDGFPEMTLTNNG